MSILSKLAQLQAKAEKSKISKVTVTFKDGHKEYISKRTGPPPHDTKPNLIMTDHGSVERFEAWSKGH